MIRLIRIMAVIIVISGLIQDRSLASEVRIALVIGNSNYLLSPLKNPVNDANDMATVLREMGFDVTLIANADQRKMESAIRSFGNSLRKGGIGLFYYAGHGLQLHGNNYLIPLNATIESEGDVKYEAVNAGLVLSKMQDAQNDLNIVILDACRNNPFARSFRSSIQGLAKMDAPKGSLIAYATAPGSVAADGEGNNGIYTKHLIENIKKPGLTMEKILKNVRIAVVEETKNKQVPWESSSLMGDFYFQTAQSVPKQPLIEPYEPELQTPISVPLPQDQGISFDDILSAAEKQAAVRTKWKEWQDKREKDFELVKMIDNNKFLTSNQKKEAWQRFYAAVSQDNPYSTQDDDMRDNSKSRINYWNDAASSDMTEKSEPSIKIKPETKPEPVEKTEPVIKSQPAITVQPLEKVETKARKTQGQLFVNTNPDNAQIRILNIKPKYYHGIELDPGRYHIEVSMYGYKTQYLWRYLQIGQDLTVDVELEKDPAPVYQASIPIRPEQVPTPQETQPVKKAESFDRTSNIVDSREGNLLKFKTGVVYDISTGLEWYKGEDRPYGWFQSKKWAEDLTVDGGGWRMPSRQELQKVFSDTVPDLLYNTGWGIWCSNSMSEPFNFRGSSTKDGFGGSDAHRSRAFAVRAGQKNRSLVVQYLKDEARKKYGDSSRYQGERKAIIAKDDNLNLVKFDTGVVFDKKTGLEWYLAPDEPIGWYAAKEWIEGLTVEGGGWRMPTIAELELTFTNTKPELLYTTGWGIWSSTSTSRPYNFRGTSTKDGFGGSEAHRSRAYAVRKTNPYLAEDLNLEDRTSKSYQASIQSRVGSKTIIAREGDLVKYSNGVVYDKRHKLEWYMAPDEPIGWFGAKNWIEKLTVDGGGWRMPNVVELKTLFGNSRPDLLRNTGWGIWSSNSMNDPYNFRGTSTKDGFGGSEAQRSRALAVRNEK